MPDTCLIRALEPGEIRAVYKKRMTRDFPADELKPLSAIEEALARGNYACYGFVEDGRILAYAYFIKDGRWALADYFAVEEELRDQGVGSHFLQALIAGPMRDFDCVLLEVEEPDCAPDAAERAHRERRLAFYLRNGLRETGVRAVVFHVPFRLLSLPGSAAQSPEQVRAIYAAMYRLILVPRVFDAMVEI